MKKIINKTRSNIVTVSPKFQVVIPKTVREKIGLKPGQKFRIMYHADRIEMIPLKTAKELRGFVKGIDTTVKREKDRV